MVSKRLIDDNWPALIPFMGNMIVVKCEYDYLSDSFEYAALSPLFRSVDEGEEVPMYNVVLDNVMGEIVYRVTGKSPTVHDVNTHEVRS